MASLARTVAMSAEVDGVGADAVIGHALRETFVAARVLAQTMGDGERYVGAGDRPCAICDLRSVGGGDKPSSRSSHLSRQGARSLSGS